MELIESVLIICLKVMNKWYTLLGDNINEACAFKYIINIKSPW